MNKNRLGLNYLSTLGEWKGGGDFTLTNIRNVLKRLGDPQLNRPALHVAGTNGKGSVSAAAAAILGRAGFRVGLNISPHLAEINERIVIDGVSISNEHLGDFANDVRLAVNREGIYLSFHEVITATAFLAFRELNVEWMVVEVGLGGRLDSSNVIERPAVTAIVSIDYDHQHILGNTLEEIAKEKAGIIKPHCPNIVGPVAPAVLKSIAGIAADVNAPLVRFGREYVLQGLTARNNGCFDAEVELRSGPNPGNLKFVTNLPGRHQVENMAVAAAMTNEIGISAKAIQEGISSVFWPSRLEAVQADGQSFLFDCAHNIAGIRSFISFLDARDLFDIDLTFGALTTKDWKEMLQPLIPRVKTWRLLEPDSIRALSSDSVESELKPYLSSTEIKIINYGRRYAKYVRETRVNGPTRYVLGSMYMVGRLRKEFGIDQRPLWERAQLPLTA